MPTPARAASGIRRYTTVAIILHWMIALGLLTVIVMGQVTDPLGLPDDVVLHAAVIIGSQANADDLPETLRAKETPAG